MIEEITNEIWSELKRYINTLDRTDAAETVVSILVDNDSDPIDIKNAFKNDPDIKKALIPYLDKEEEYSDDEEEYDEEDDDEWDN